MTQQAIPVPVTVVEEPGVYDGMPDDIYHGDPVPAGSLSSSGARQILLECPARYRYEQDHGRAAKRAWDLGHAAHAKVLGVGATVHEVPFSTYNTKAAQAVRDEARAAGEVPLLSHEVAQVDAMAAAIREHPVASALFDPANGLPEQSLFWTDRRHRTWRRARFDWLPNPRSDGRLIIPDYKTTTSARPSAIRKTIHQWLYNAQADWYREAARACQLADDVEFVFVFQEKTAPYLITVVQVDDDAMTLGRDLNRKALETYAECVATGRWPGYTDDVELLSLPLYAQYDQQEMTQ